MQGLVASSTIGDFVNPTPSSIHPILQIRSHFKKRQLFRFDIYHFTGLWVAAGIWFICFDVKQAQSPDFDPVTLFERCGHFTEKYLDTFGCFGLGQVLGFLYGLDEFEFIHCVSLVSVEVERCVGNLQKMR